MTMTTQTTTKTKAATKPIPELPANPFTFEVLELASKQRTKAKKIEVLQKYGHDSIKAVLIWNFDESVISLLPQGDVPYNSYEDTATQSGSLSDKIKDAVDAIDRTGANSMGATDDGRGRIRSSIMKEWTKFYNFIKGGNDGMSSLKRESMFINILEMLHPKDAEILVLVKDKQLQSKYRLTQEIVAGAYPDIQWGGRS